MKKGLSTVLSNKRKASPIFNAIIELTINFPLNGMLGNAGVVIPVGNLTGFKESIPLSSLKIPVSTKLAPMPMATRMPASKIKPFFGVSIEEAGTLSRFRITLCVKLFEG